MEISRATLLVSVVLAGLDCLLSCALVSVLLLVILFRLGAAAPGLTGVLIGDAFRLVFIFTNGRVRDRSVQRVHVREREADSPVCALFLPVVEVQDDLLTGRVAGLLYAGADKSQVELFLPREADLLHDRLGFAFWRRADVVRRLQCEATDLARHFFSLRFGFQGADVDIEEGLGLRNCQRFASMEGFCLPMRMESLALSDLRRRRSYCVLPVRRCQG